MSKATNILGTSIIKATATGNKLSQQRLISWSYLSRGRVALNHTNIKQNIQVLIPSITDWILKKVSLTNNSGIWYPPKNRRAVIVLNNTIELYSARKKNTKGTEECSVKNPATSSDSFI